MSNLTTSLQNLTEKQQQDLIASIRSGECVLVLGPYANLVQEENVCRSQRVRLANFLAKNDRLQTQTPINPEDQDSLNTVICQLLLDEKIKEGNIRTEIKNFYSMQAAPPSDSPYELIVQLGFRNILSTDPDSRLIKVFEDFNRSPMGLYCRSDYNSNPNADPKLDPKSIIVPFLTSERESYPIILHLFGLAEYTVKVESSSSLLIGPEDEFNRMHILTSEEIIKKIIDEFGDRITMSQWYLFVGFNFNSWLMGAIFYFVSKLTQKIKDPYVFGLHSKPQTQLASPTISYYKNLFPSTSKKNDIQIVQSDTRNFFIELKALYDKFPTPKRKPTRSAFVVYHRSDQDNFDRIRKQLEGKLTAHKLKAYYNHNKEINTLDDAFTEEQIQEHILTDPVVVYLISTNWEADSLYDVYWDLARERKKGKKTFLCWLLYWMTIVYMSLVRMKQ
ncbi:hypothetical protein [Spirosoma aerophilum]